MYTRASGVEIWTKQ